jgi:hypothetical protein
MDRSYACSLPRSSVRILACCFTIPLVLTTASFAIAPDFTRVSPLYRFPVHATPSAIAVGDLDGDGNPDAVTANPDSNDVAILLGRGDGTLEHASYVPVGIDPVRVALADFNGDGKLDAAVVNRGSNSVSILLGDGLGGFGSAANYPVGVWPEPLVVIDINHDARVDVAVVNKRSNNVSVLISNGDGTFAPAVAFAVGIEPNSIVASDFDADGHLDLATANDQLFLDWTEDVSVLYGIGDGTFAPKVIYPADLNPQNLLSGDFDGDGRIDLAVTAVGYDTASPPMTWVQAVSILRNTGARTFARAVRTTLPFTPTSIAAGHFNADNRLDLVISHARGVSILPGASDGSFGSPIAGGAASGALHVGAVADWNGDGVPDLAFPGDRSVYIAMGRGDGTFVNYEEYARIPFLLAADFNGDGRHDVALLDDWYSTVAVRLSNGDGTFGPPLSRAVGHSPRHGVTADFNGDGRADLAFNQGNASSVGILLGNGNGTFGPLTSLPYQARSVASGDFDGDGDMDLALAQTWSAAVLLGNGDGTFAPPTVASTCTSDWIATGDFNADSKTDLAVFGVNCGVGILFGQGNGTFAAVVNRGSMSCGLVLGLRAADFNHDGLSDVLIFGGQNGACSVPVLSILLGGGDWSTVSHSNLRSGREPVIADFDGDGRRDIAFLNLAPTDDVSVILGRPDGSFGSPILFDSGTSALAAATGDFNGDGKPDLAFSTAFSSSLSVLLNSSNPVEIHSIMPTGGGTTGGDVVTISGVTLGGTTAVTFGIALGTITANTPTSITVTTPPHAIGPVDVTVTSAGGSVTSPTPFTYAQAATTVTDVPTLSELVLLALAATLLAIAVLRFGR